MRKMRVLALAAAAMITAAAGVALAADMTAVIQARQAHYKVIGGASKGINDQLNSATPDVAAIQGYARTLDQLAPQIPSWFPAGSGPESGVKTLAKAEIWTQPAAFAAAAAGFATEARHFDMTAAGGNVDAIRAEYPTLAKACGNCHGQFRAKPS